MKNPLLILIVLLLVGMSGFGQDNSDTSSNSIPTFHLKGIVKCFEMKKPINNATVKIMGTDGTTREVKTDSNGIFYCELDSNTSYSINVSKSKHINSRGKETTVGHIESKLFFHEYELRYSPGCGPMLPILSYTHNTATHIKGDSLILDAANVLHDIMTENPTLVVQITGYRDSTEKKFVSNKRVKDYAIKVIALGIDKRRIVIEDGGIRNVKERIKDPHENYYPYNDIPNPYRTVTTKVVRSDYVPRK
ncbi:MAG: hypothetical protein COB15_00930 [Flavobacteriales bacterium]|nr:MAG: hypothetical protein COB15_00930 [Flavobacteriales bacterium]